MTPASDRFALEDAVEAGDVEAARALLDGGADPNARCHGVETTVFALALGRGDATMVRLFHHYGVDLAVPGPGLLHTQASTMDANPMLPVLLELGVDVNGKDEHGWTALHHAAAHGYHTNADALLAGGADPTVETRHGLLPADLAAANGWVALESRLRRENSV